MGAQSHAEHQAKVTITCSYDERLYIKMLAEKAHMNLSEFILSYLRKDFPVKKKTPNKKTPNKKTLAAMKEAEEGGGIECDSIDDFWEKMGIDRSA